MLQKKEAVLQGRIAELTTRIAELEASGQGMEAAYKNACARIDKYIEDTKALESALRRISEFHTRSSDMFGEGDDPTGRSTISRLKAEKTLFQKIAHDALTKKTSA